MSKWEAYIESYIPRKSGNEPLFFLRKLTKKDKKNMWYGIVECPYCHKPKELRLDVCVLPIRSCGCVKGENISKVKRSEQTMHQDFGDKRFYKTASGYWKSADGIWMHRYVWESSNREAIPADYEIHHIDHDRSNNNPDNLIAMPSVEHKRLHKID